MTAGLGATLEPWRFTTRARSQDERRSWRRLYASFLLLTVICAVLAAWTAPQPLVVTLLIYILAGGWILLRPAAGIYVVTFLTLLGDAAVTPWYPFVKNLSSRESISFIHDSLTITPIELMLVLTMSGWLLGLLVSHSRRVRRGGILAPMVLFFVIVVAALGRAIVGAGDLRIAMFEGRALLYLPVMYFLIVQLFDHEAQYRRLFRLALVAILGHSLFAMNHYFGLDEEAQQALESLTEHSASVHVAAVLVLLFALFTVPGCSNRLRLLALVVAVPASLEFVYSERRSAAVGLIIGLLLLVLFLYKLNRRTLVAVVPLIAIVAVGYLGAFWNNEGPWGLGAQAVKSVVSPDEIREADRTSGIYRQLEAFDIWFTIRTQPLTGVGFGNPFYQPWPLPYLPGFEFRDFIPHNNILWIWLKLGVFGFVTTAFLFGRSIQFGVRSVLRLAKGDGAALGVAAVAYIAMYMVFAYVDIAWDARSTVFLAFTMAFCTHYAGTTQPGNEGSSDAVDRQGSAADPMEEDPGQARPDGIPVLS